MSSTRRSIDPRSTTFVAQNSTMSANAVTTLTFTMPSGEPEATVSKSGVIVHPMATSAPAATPRQNAAGPRPQGSHQGRSARFTRDPMTRSDPTSDPIHNRQNATDTLSDIGVPGLTGNKASSATTNERWNTSMKFCSRLGSHAHSRTSRNTGATSSSTRNVSSDTTANRAEANWMSANVVTAPDAANAPA